MKIDKAKLFLYILTTAIGFLIAGFLLKKYYNFIFSALCLYIAYLFMYYYKTKGVIKITDLVNGLLVMTIVLHVAVGQYFELYDSNLQFDKGLHMFGTYTITLFTYQILNSFFKNYLSNKLLIFILICSVSITAGVFLEIIEFLLDIMFHSNNQKGLMDTDIDLIANILGALAAGFAVIKKQDI